MRTALAILIIATSLAAVLPLHAQQQDSEVITVGNDKFLRWYGHSGRTYFVQVSDPNDPLKTWTWAPVIEPGDGVNISYEVDGTASSGFYRLWFSDQPTIDPDGDDFDGDGLSNLNEIEFYQTNPLKWDNDGDGLNDYDEIFVYYTWPSVVDCDADGLNDFEEVITHGSNPWLRDTDEDSLPDGDEVHINQTNPLEMDSDGDWMWDGWELTMGLDPTNSADGLLDEDHDNLPNQLEFVFMDKGYDPFTANSAAAFPWNEDPDCDDITTVAELVTHRTNPRQPDTDEDFMPDGWEIRFAFNAKTHNSKSSNPNDDWDMDPDLDNLTNGEESIFDTNPNNPDTDGDEITDDVEIQQGSNPNDPNDHDPPPKGTVSVNVTFGDDSGSHSEKYKLVLTPLEGDTGGIRFRTNRQYGMPQTDTFQLPKGAKYKMELKHAGTQPKFMREHGFSNYDWTLDIDTSANCLVVDDPQGIVTTVEDWPNSTFQADGKSATLHVPLFEWVTPKGDPVAAPDDAGDGQNEFTYNEDDQGIFIMDLKIHVRPSGTAALTGHDGVRFSDRGQFIVPGIGISVKEWFLPCPDGKPYAVGDFLVAQVSYTGLPLLNSDLGLKKAEFRFDGSNVMETTDFEVFFSKNGTNHPGVGPWQFGTPPNWFYYWKDGNVCGIPTNAIYDEVTGNSIDAYGFVKPGVDTILRLCPLAPTTNEGSQTYTGLTPFGTITVGGSGEGIACVFETVVHEVHHLDLYSLVSGRTDSDHDGIADSDEGGLDGLISDPTKRDTYRMGGAYALFGDNEIRCRKIETTTPANYHPEMDWANPGCQSLDQFGPLAPQP
jgi:hypothetical protein